jgi:hypothetical protein
MEAKDLRIGNLINYHMVDELDERTEWDELNTVDIDDLTWLLNHSEDQNFKPIPLTPEWLEKLGFIPKSTGWFEKKIVTIMTDSVSIININVRSGSCSLMDDDDDTGSPAYLRPTRFVHDLMNLYFALTGKELIIK